MNTILNFTIILLMIIFSSCNDKNSGEPLVIKNNTNNRIYFWFSYWDNIDFSNYHYPDTILPKEKPILISSIAPQNASGCGENDPNWDDIFSKLKTNKFTVYFFENLPQNQSEWDSIRNNYALTRKDVTYDEFIKNNYTISYP